MFLPHLLPIGRPTHACQRISRRNGAVKNQSIQLTTRGLHDVKYQINSFSYTHCTQGSVASLPQYLSFLSIFTASAFILERARYRIWLDFESLTSNPIVQNANNESAADLETKVDKPDAGCWNRIRLTTSGRGLKVFCLGLIPSSYEVLVSGV